MILVSSQNVSEYLEHDVVAEKLAEMSVPGDEMLTCQDWLLKTEAKRFVFHRMYGDLLESSGLRILDVGGGLTCFTRQLASRHDYVLVDRLAHDDEDTAECFRRQAGRNYIHNCDWYDFEQTGPFDVVVANDLFPNVDQRLDMFIKRYLPRCGGIRLSMTYYDEPRFYRTKRLDADEFLSMLAWDGRVLSSVLHTYQTNIVDLEPEIFAQGNKSVYPNGRQVCLVKMSNNPAPNQAPHK